MTRKALIQALAQAPVPASGNRVGLALALTTTRQKTVCDALQIPAHQMSRIVAGSVPAVDTAQRLAGFWGVPVEVLFPAESTSEVA